jgi:hypothetical protein
VYQTRETPSTVPPGTDPCEHYRKTPDNCTSSPNGDITCHICGHTYNKYEYMPRRLAELCQNLQEQNPTHTFLVDGDVVWLRLPSTGKDYGVYSAMILGVIVQVMDFDSGMTVVSREIPT